MTKKPKPGIIFVKADEKLKNDLRFASEWKGCNVSSFVRMLLIKEIANLRNEDKEFARALKARA